jgi:hypothetical protein
VIADRDPIVARALDLYLPELDANAGALFVAARADAAGMRVVRRRRQTIAALAFAAFLLLAGAAVAAQQFDLLPFLHTNDRNTARFAVSPSDTYQGAAPQALSCANAKVGTFVCNVTGTMAPGNRTYQLGMRVDEVPSLTRQGMLDSLDKAQAGGADPNQIARVRDDLDKVGDDFIRALAVLSRIETVAGGDGSTSSSGAERVPPRGVPAWTACREVTLTTYSCRPLAALTGVASGTPLYFLQPSSDWRTVKAPRTQQSDFMILLERVLGRKPNADETRFFIDFATVTVGTASSSSGPTQTQTVGTPGPRAAALLAPQSLGVPTRIVSATGLPLRQHPPGALRRTGTRLYRVVFDTLRADGVDRVGCHTIYVYVTRSDELHVWSVALVASK